MDKDTVSSPSVIEWGVATCALPGQAVSGDLHLVKSFGECVLIAAVDGVGHGNEALAAARIAVTVLEAHPEEPLPALLRRCHVELYGTRGVVTTLACLD